MVTPRFHSVNRGQRGRAVALRVRTVDSYPASFVVDLGQRNSALLKRNADPLLAKLHWRLARHMPPAIMWMATNAFTLLPEWDFDLVHLVNAVPLLCPRPYVLTFESFMPRVPDDRYRRWLHVWLRRLLLRPRCLALVAMSEYALRQFAHQNRGFEAFSRLTAKTQLIYPAVHLRRSHPKRSSDSLSLLFVGRQFMQKGGPAVLRAHERLRRRGVPVQTTVVSGLDWTDFVGPPSAAYVHQETARLAAEGVIHISRLPNQEVIDLMQRADYLVAPTLHDTFGFACIEALSCGTPVIATDTCALPEIVEHGHSGLLLPFDNEKHVGKWRWLGRTAAPGYLDVFDQTIESLAKALTDSLMAQWDTRPAYEEMSAGAIERVCSRFSRTNARDRLEQIYERACRAT